MLTQRRQALLLGLTYNLLLPGPIMQKISHNERWGTASIAGL